jgi:ABC-type glycerol-3-phosphate transport system permease component
MTINSIPVGPKPKYRAPVSWPQLLIYAVLVIGALLSVLPFVYMIMTSLKTYGSIINNNLWPWFPFGNEGLQFQNYPEAIQDIGFDKDWNMPLLFRYFANTAIIAAAIVAGTLITSSFAAYALSHIDLPGKNIIFVMILATIMIPNDLTLVPKVVMIFQFQWYNTFQALIVPFLVSVYGIFLLRQFFMQIPRDLFDAAKMDGAGHLRYLFTIVMPLSKPALITVALLNFIAAWDSFKWPLLVTKDNNMRVLGVGLQQFMQGEGVRTDLLMAFSTLVVLPVVVFYFFTQKQFTEGITRTGIKG